MQVNYQRIPLRSLLLIILIHVLADNRSMMAQRTVCFSGLEWNVRDGFGGPGPNSFSASAENVWTDSLGFLHLKIRKIGDQWLCSEVYLQQSYGYGEYLFEVQSDLEAYDPNIVRIIHLRIG